MVARRKPPARDMRAQLEALVSTHGLTLTVQRRIILEALLPRTDHPTADAVVEHVRTSHPDIGRATVYRTLDRLVALGVIRRLGHPGAAMRYDPNPARHHHVVCRECGSMVDIHAPEMNTIALPATLAQGFDIEDYSIQFRGVCGGCRKKGQRKQSARKRRKT